MTIRRSCTWIAPCLDDGKKFTTAEQTTGRGKAYQTHDNPDFLRAMRALSDYHEWVEGRLMPIAAKWMAEHRSELLKMLNEKEMDDVGAAVEAGYKLVAGTEWWQKIQSQAKDKDFMKQLLKEFVPNPIWQEATAQFKSAEDKIRAKFKHQATPK